MTDGVIPAEVREGPGAIRATIAAARPAAREIGAAWRARGVRRVHVIGNGTSYHSCLAAAMRYRRHACPDDPIVVPVTAADFRLYPPVLDERDVVVGISSSGEFHDVVAVAESLRGRVPFSAIVHVPGSSLTRVASDVILSAGGPSRVPVMTKTFSATLVATELLLDELLGEGRASELAEGFGAAANAAEAAIDAAEPLVDDLAASLADASHLFVAGGGLAWPAAQEAALKLKEIALVHAEASETWEMTSGAATMLGPETVVVALAPDGPARSAMGGLLGHAVEWGARVIEVGPARLVAGSDLLPLPPDAEEEHTALHAVPPIVLLAFSLARRRGLDPDRPGWIERYHRQGLTHILGAGEVRS